MNHIQGVTFALFIIAVLYYLLVVRGYKEVVLSKAQGFLMRGHTSAAQAAAAADVSPEVKAFQDALAAKATEHPQTKATPPPITNHISLECPNLAVGRHRRTTVGDPVPNSEPNVTTLSVFNPTAKGVLPQNHMLFDAPANFGSDVTNISQFYKLNPEMLQRTIGSPGIKSVADWESQANQMVNKIDLGSGPLQPANFESMPETSVLKASPQ